jgi:hypothetical protein
VNKNRKVKEKLGKKFFVLSSICLVCLFSLSFFPFSRENENFAQVGNVVVCFGLNVSVSFLVSYFLGKQMEGHVLII